MPKRNLIWIAAIIALALLAVWLAKPPPKETGPFEPLIQIDHLAREYYVETPPKDAILGAIRGYLRELDPFCRYIQPEWPQYLDRIVQGRRCDLGLHYVIEGGQVRILGAMPDSPSLQAGVRGGDVLLAVNSIRIDSPTRRKVDELLDGPENQVVPLLVRRGQEELTLRPLRLPYSVETVTGICRQRDGQWVYWIDPDARIAYVRIAEFATGTADAFDAVATALTREELAGLVLDLRDNPGGPLREALEVVDRFVDSGLVLLIRGRDGEERLMARADRALGRMNIVVLVNGQTVSAPEVVAGAMKQHRRAVLVGERTFGKNVIQKPFELGMNMGTVMLTTARYYFSESAATQPQSRPTSRGVGGSGEGPGSPGVPPNGRGDAGIAPDLTVEQGATDIEALRSLRYFAEALPAPTTRPTTRPSTRPSSQPAAPPELAKIMRLDRQLAKAVDLLRSPEAMAAILRP
jgi:carboxyl-terminal processing protease